MTTLTPTERRALRAKAHHLHPVVSIGQHGLTSAVLHEVDIALRAHELVKIRVFSDNRSEREGFLARICAELDAASVQHLGKLLIVWRRAPEPVAAETVPAARTKPGKTAGPPRGATSRADTRKPAGSRKRADTREAFGTRKPAGARKPSDTRRKGAPATTAKPRGYAAAGARRRRTPR